MNFVLDLKSKNIFEKIWSLKINNQAPLKLSMSTTRLGAKKNWGKKFGTKNLEKKKFWKTFFEKNYENWKIKHP